LDRSTFVVPGQPKPKGRPRFARGRIYSPSGPEEKRLREHIRMQMVHKDAYEVDVALKVTFYREDKRRVDLDNMVKLLTDAMNGLVYVDDVQIVDIHAKKLHDKRNPRTEVEIWEN
jgi:Holliday junction resolvase RusA-like endonuclease